MLKIIKPASYNKREKRFFKGRKHLIGQYVKTLKLLALNPMHPALRLHKINNKDCYSISINMQYRILLTFKYLDNGEILLIDIGDHSIY